MAGPKATPATRALNEAGLEHRLHHYTFAPGDDGIGQQAAAALGVAPPRLLKTLVVAIEGKGLLLALLGVDRSLELKTAAASVGGRRAELATAVVAERATGYVKGGISPIGTRRRLPTVIDEEAATHATVFVNGGRRGLQIEITPHALIEVTRAHVHAIGRLR